MEPDQINELFRTVGRIEQKQDHTIDLLKNHGKRIARAERRINKILLVATAVGTPLIWLGKKMIGAI